MIVYPNFIPEQTTKTAAMQEHRRRQLLGQNAQIEKKGNRILVSSCLPDAELCQPGGASPQRGVPLCTLTLIFRAGVFDRSSDPTLVLLYYCKKKKKKDLFLSSFCCFSGHKSFFLSSLLAVLYHFEIPSIFLALFSGTCPC